MDDTAISLQERYAPRGVCFGCGPANPDGLHVRSFPSADDPSTVVAEWMPETQFEAFEGILNGGIVGALLDCHSNWTAARHLMTERGADRPSTCVTLEYAVRLHRPTPSDRPVRLTARVVESAEDRAIVESRLESGGELTATLRGTFVAVKPDHPAYDHW